MMTTRMRSLGTSSKAAFTPLAPHIGLNSLRLCSPRPHPRCGSFGPRLRSSSLCGLRSKIGFGPMIGWTKEGGLMAGIVRFATRL
jgi:hypothetical protein